MDQLACLQHRDLGNHVEQDRVLGDSPTIGRQHVLTALVQDSIQRIAADIEGHGIGAWIQGHLAKIMMIVQVGHDTTGRRIML